MFENPRRGRQARKFTTNVPKILDLKSSSEQIFSENWRWVPLTDERFREYFTAFRSVFTTNFSASLRSQLWNELFDREVSAFIFYNIYFATHGVHILLLTAQMKGFMSTFRPLVQPVLSMRRISVYCILTLFDHA